MFFCRYFNVTYCTPKFGTYFFNFALQKFLKIANEADTQEYCSMNLISIRNLFIAIESGERSREWRTERKKEARYVNRNRLKEIRISNFHIGIVNRFKCFHELRQILRKFCQCYRTQIQIFVAATKPRSHINMPNRQIFYRMFALMSVTASSPLNAVIRFIIFIFSFFPFKSVNWKWTFCEQIFHLMPFTINLHCSLFMWHVRVWVCASFISYLIYLLGGTNIWVIWKFKINRKFHEEKLRGQNVVH